MKILVTGGLVYIGYHVFVLLLEKGVDVVLVDKLDNARIEVLEQIERITGKRPSFEQVDLKDQSRVEALFETYPDLEGCIHFAAHKAVGESIEQPLLYYENNIGGLVNILKPLTRQGIPLIFSSSCTVYGQARELPITEETPLQPSTSPYGFTKQMGEQIIQDSCKANPNFKSILLRYFNPIGAHPSAQIGEYPQGVPQNLVPFLTQTVIGKRPLLNVFGSNYDTPDGTCIRDYIHVMDLAQAHIESLNYLLSSKQNSSCEIFNVGTGRGASVLELIQEFERATGEKVPYELSAPRAGDTVAAFADVTKIEKQLGWKAQFSLQEALKSAWDWEQQIHVLS